MIGITKYKKYLDSYSENFYVYCVVKVQDKKLTLHTNVGITPAYAESVKDFANNSKCKNIIYTVRSSNEPYAEEYPTSDVKEVLFSNKKTVKFFNQEPWPTPVPNFDSKNLVIRLGFDDGCELDKLFKYSQDTDLPNGTYHYLISNNNIIELKTKTSFI